MAELTVRLELRVSPRLARWGLAAALLTCPVAELGSETVTLTPYYPAPSGVYTRMITTDNTFLARDTGRVGIGTTDASTGKLTILSSGTGWTDGISLRYTGSTNRFQIIHDSPGRMGVGYNAGALVGFHSNGGMSVGSGQWTTVPALSNSLLVQDRAMVMGKLLAGMGNVSASNGTNFNIESGSAIRARQTSGDCTPINTGDGLPKTCGANQYATTAIGFYSERMLLGGPQPSGTNFQQVTFYCCNCGGSCNPN